VLLPLGRLGITTQGHSQCHDTFGQVGDGRSQLCERFRVDRQWRARHVRIYRAIPGGGESFDVVKLWHHASVQS
jgi:hypothetical protein